IRAKKTSIQDKILAYRVAIWLSETYQTKQSLYVGKAKLHLSNEEYSVAAADYIKALQYFSPAYNKSLKAQICADFYAEATKLLSAATKSKRVEDYEKVCLVYHALTKLDDGSLKAQEILDNLRSIMAEYKGQDYFDEKSELPASPSLKLIHTSRSDEELKKEYEQQLQSFFADKKDVNSLHANSDLVCAGWEAITQQDTKKAIECFEEAIAAFPQDFISLTHLGVCYSHLKEFDKAEKLFCEAIEKYDFTMAYHGLAAVYVERGWNTKAHDIYTKIILRKEPYFPVDGLKRLSILRCFNDVDKNTNTALAEFFIKEQIKSITLEDCLARATDAVKQGNHEAAIHYTTAALYHLPDNYQIYVERAEARLRLKQYKLVRLDISLAWWASQVVGLGLSKVAYVCKTADRLIKVAGGLFASNQLNDALQLYEAAALIQPLPELAQQQMTQLIEWLSNPINPSFFTKIYPKQTKYNTLLEEGREFEEKGEDNSALQKYQAASILCPGIAEGTLRTAALYKKIFLDVNQKEQLVDKISQLYKQVLISSPYQAHASYELAMHMKEQSNNEEAVKIDATYNLARMCEENFESYYYGHLQQALSRDRQSIIANASIEHASKGQKALHAKNSEEAYFHYHLALLRFPDDVVSLNGLAVMHLSDKDHELAMLYFDRAINLYRFPSAFYGRGMLNFMLKDYGKALSDFRQALDLDSKLEHGLTDNERDATLHGIEAVEGCAEKVVEVLANAVKNNNISEAEVKENSNDSVIKEKESRKLKKAEVAKKRKEELKQKQAKQQAQNQHNYLKKLYRKEQHQESLAAALRKKQEEKKESYRRALSELRTKFSQLKSSYIRLSNVAHAEVEASIIDTRKILQKIELKFIEQQKFRQLAQVELLRKKKIEEKNEILKNIHQSFREVKASKNHLLIDVRREAGLFLSATAGLFNTISRAVDSYEQKMFPLKVLE
ncbi:MAG TPA: tetratricopeptide repeat protein, partial [Gammaproteobacteria bacterium]|nr:tetratricopeptide repeat protein [Gammaproteobacteria bacterium]